MKKIVFGLLMAVAVAGYASAHKGATGIVKERMMAMKDIGGLVKQLANLDWSEERKAQKEIISVSNKLLKHANAMPELFPKGSNEKPSEALDAIWTNKEGFAAAIVEMEKAAIALKESGGTISSADDIKPFIKDLGKTCSTCHTDYRKAKQ